ncbi:MAG: hypothetical protein QM791_04620 [Ferruginibacter sp.]
MRKLVILCVLCVVLAVNASAQKGGQEYQTAVGVKFYPGAITVKHFLQENRAIEGLGYFWDRGFRVTGLYEIHGDINDVSGLKWYVGPGAHLGFYNSKYYNGGTSIGIDGVLGLDYKFDDVPINLSLDWQPSFEFGNYNGFTGNFGGISIRYTLN